MALQRTVSEQILQVRELTALVGQVRQAGQQRVPPAVDVHEVVRVVGANAHLRFLVLTAADDLCRARQDQSAARACLTRNVGRGKGLEATGALLLRTCEEPSHQGKPPKSHCMTVPVCQSPWPPFRPWHMATNSLAYTPAWSATTRGVCAHLSTDVRPRAQNHEEANTVTKLQEMHHVRSAVPGILVGEQLVVVPRYVHL